MFALMMYVVKHSTQRQIYILMKKKKKIRVNKHENYLRKIFAFLASQGFYYIPLMMENIIGSAVGVHRIN